MARFKNEAIVVDALRAHLRPGEQLRHWAYGVKQPHLMLIILLICLAVLPGLIAVALLTKEYILALTDRRLLVVRFKGKMKIQEISEYSPAEWKSAEASTGALFTHIRFRDKAKPFRAKFHRMGMPNNRPEAEAIAKNLAMAV